MLGGVWRRRLAFAFTVPRLVDVTIFLAEGRPHVFDVILARLECHQARVEPGRQIVFLPVESGRTELADTESCRPFILGGFAAECDVRRTRQFEHHEGQRADSVDGDGFHFRCGIREDDAVHRHLRDSRRDLADRVFFPGLEIVGLAVRTLGRIPPVEHDFGFIALFDHVTGQSCRISRDIVIPIRPQPIRLDHISVTVHDHDLDVVDLITATFEGQVDH